MKLTNHVDGMSIEMEMNRYHIYAGREEGFAIPSTGMVPNLRRFEVQSALGKGWRSGCIYYSD